MAYAREGGWSVTPGGEHRGGGSSGALGAWPTTNLIWIPEADNKHSARLRKGRNTGEWAYTSKMEVIESIGSGGRPALQVVAKVRLASAPGSEY